MKRLAIASIALFFGGLALIVLGVICGEGIVGIFFVFPYIAGSGPIMLIGILLILTSFLAQFLSLFRAEGKKPGGMDQYISRGRRINERSDSDIKAEGGAIILIGPIPIVIASSHRLAAILLAIAVAILSIAFIHFLLLTLS